MNEDGEKGKSISVTISLLLIGVILLVLVYSNSNLMVSDEWIPAINTRPNSLVCYFQRLEFSKEPVISNITGERFVLLTITYSGLDNFTVYTERPLDDIQEVGYLTWRNNGAYCILSEELPSGDYIIGTGEVEYVGKYETKENYQFLNIEEIHAPTMVERFIMESSYIPKIVIVFALTLIFSMILLSIIGIAEYFEIEIGLEIER